MIKQQQKNKMKAFAQALVFITGETIMLILKALSLVPKPSHYRFFLELIPAVMSDHLHLLFPVLFPFSADSAHW